MAAKKWKVNASDLPNKEKVVSFFGDVTQKIAAVFEVANHVGVADLIGIDIGPERIKLLKINNGVSPYQVVEYATIPLPAGAIVKDEIKNSDAVGSALTQLISQAGVSAKYAAVAIPRTLAIIKNIPVDKRFTSDEIESRAWIEANRLFPDLIGNIYLDFTITGPVIGAQDQLDLLMVASRKEHIKPYLEVVQRAGLIPQIVDVNCYALERALRAIILNHTELKTPALLNVNLTQSSLIVLQNDQLIHAHDQTFDGQRLLKQVEEYIKKRSAQPELQNAPLEIADAGYLALLQENFLSHLRHNIHFFYSSRPNVSIDKIYLAGDCTTVPDFSAFIEKELGIPTELAQPFKHMLINQRLNVEEINQSAPSLMLCSGLALSSIGDNL